MSATTTTKKWRPTADNKPRNKSDTSASLVPGTTTAPQWQSFLFPCVAASIAAPFTNPFGVAKTQLQAQKGTGSSRQYRGMLDFFRKAAFSSGGFRTLQRGAVPVTMREASSNFFRIGLYNPILSHIHDEGEAAPIWKRMVAGGISGAVGAIVCNPFEIVRIRVQAQSLDACLGPRYFSSSILEKEGVGGSTKRVVVNLTTYTLFHETATHRFAMEDGPLVDTGCALLSGFFAALAMNPIDVLRTRLMTQSSPSTYRNAIDAAVQIARTEGAKAFLKGFTPSFLRIGPHFVLTFLLLEQMRRIAHPYNAERSRDVYLTDLFHRIDADSSGVISYNELYDVLLSTDPHNNPVKAEKETHTLFHLADADGSGSIDLDEFLAAARTSHLDRLIRGQQLLSVFRGIDISGDGKIDELELLHALRTVRRRPTADSSKKKQDEFESQLHQDVHRIMDEVDKDGDRNIDFAEFVEAYDKMSELEEHRLFKDVVLGAGVALGAA